MDKQVIKQLIKEENWEDAFDELAQPLHERLYAKQTFDILTEFTVAERGIISFDYVRGQVGQGGFIQLIQNGYISLLVPVIESLQELSVAPEMSTVLDDVLKVFVLNKDALSKETSVEEFARLYDEFKEFEGLEAGFAQALPETVKGLVVKAAEDM